MEYPSPDDPDRFEERLRTRFLIAVAFIALGLAIGVAGILAGPGTAVLYTVLVVLAVCMALGLKALAKALWSRR